MPELYTLPKFNPQDPLSIPKFLRRKVGDPQPTWPKGARSYFDVYPDAMHVVSEVTNHSKAEEEAHKRVLDALEEDRKAAARRRIDKMKRGFMLRKQRDRTGQTWDATRRRPCWVWIATGQPVRYNPDGSIIPLGNMPPATTEKKVMATKSTAAKKPATKKAAAKKPAAAKAAAKATPQRPGIIAEIKAVCSRKQGASIEEILAHLKGKFPERDPRPTTARINANLYATRKEKDEKRGLVYYIESTEKAA